MSLGKNLYELRRQRGMTQEEFAENLNVSRQAVQKWEAGASQPDIDKLCAIANRFGVSLDALLDIGTDSAGTQPNRITERDYSKLAMEEKYIAGLATEYQECVDEGRDISQYKALFEAVRNMSDSIQKEKMAEVLFELICAAGTMKDYPYREPDDLEGIRALRRPYPLTGTAPGGAELRDRISGAWYGRISGCMLGKTVEGIRTNELWPFLKETDNFPMHRYILSAEVTDETRAKYRFFRSANRLFADRITCMPWDDDTNYTVLYQEIVERYGKDFTSLDVSQAWREMMPERAYWTAERVAYLNMVRGILPPRSAVCRNPYREWIGAQIRADYFGYINPGDPEKAAEMAWRDARVSHVKNGIYGEMFAAAMLACAAVEKDIAAIIRGGLAQIPCTSRLYRDVSRVLDGYESGMAQEDCFGMIHEAYDEYTGYGWCHTNPNAMIVAAALLYGGGDYGRSVCMAVQTGFDTDCNGATVGSVLGIRGGMAAVGKEWYAPFRGELETSIVGLSRVKIEDRIDMTVRHVTSK